MSRPSTASPSSASWSGFCFHDILRFLIEKCILKGFSFLAEMHEVPGTVPTRPRTAEAILTSSAGVACVLYEKKYRLDEATCRQICDVIEKRRARAEAEGLTEAEYIRKYGNGAEQIPGLRP